MTEDNLILLGAGHVIKIFSCVVLVCGLRHHHFLFALIFER